MYKQGYNLLIYKTRSRLTFNIHSIVCTFIIYATTTHFLSSFLLVFFNAFPLKVRPCLYRTILTIEFPSFACFYKIFIINLNLEPVSKVLSLFLIVACCLLRTKFLLSWEWPQFSFFVCNRLTKIKPRHKEIHCDCC